MSALCSGGRHYLYPPGMFAIQKSLKGSPEQRAVSTSLSRCTEMQDIFGENFPQQLFAMQLALCDNFWPYEINTELHIHVNLIGIYDLLLSYSFNILCPVTLPAYVSRLWTSSSASQIHKVYRQIKSLSFLVFLEQTCFSSCLHVIKISSIFFFIF